MMVLLIALMQKVIIDFIIPLILDPDQLEHWYKNYKILGKLGEQLGDEPDEVDANAKDMAVGLKEVFIKIYYDAMNFIDEHKLEIEGEITVELENDETNNILNEVDSTDNAYVKEESIEDIIKRKIDDSFNGVCRKFINGGYAGLDVINKLIIKPIQCMLLSKTDGENKNIVFIDVPENWDTEMINEFITQLENVSQELSICFIMLSGMQDGVSFVDLDDQLLADLGLQRIKKRRNKRKIKSSV